MVKNAVYTSSVPPRRITARAAAEVLGLSIATMQRKFRGESPMHAHELVALAEVYPDLRVEVIADQLAERYRRRHQGETEAP